MSGESQQGTAKPSTRGAAEFRSRNFRGDRRRKFFRAIAKHAYPSQTVHEIRRLTREQYGERTIYDWIAGRSEPPMAVCMQIMGEIFSD